MTDLPGREAGGSLSDACVSPALTGRLFGRMAVAGSFQIFLDVVLAGSLDRPMLERALALTIADYPRRLVRLAGGRTGLERRFETPASIDPRVLIRDHPTASALELRRGDALDLPARVSAFVRIAAGQSASLTSVFVAALTEAAHATWPQADDTPIAIDVPVSLRDPQAGVADRGAPFRFRVPARIARDFSAILDAVREHARSARTGAPSIVQAFASALPSYLPPSALNSTVGGFFRANPTGGDSLCISNVVAPTRRLRDYGPVLLSDARLYADASRHRAMVIPSPRGPQVAFSYFTSLIANSNVAQVIRRVAERLAALTAPTAA